jgi:osmotically-inducible protein OsmY
MGCAATQKHEQTKSNIDDSVISAKIKAAILDVNTLQVYVKTHKGVVLLSGYVDSAQRVTHVGNIARRVENVVSVENDLVVNNCLTSGDCKTVSD